MPIPGILASQISGHLFVPSGAYDALASVTVPSGGVSSVIFAGIPNGYKHLQVRTITRGSEATIAQLWNVRFNADTGNNYYGCHILYGNGSAAGVYPNGPTNAMYWSDLLGSSTSANYFATSITDVLDYSNPNKNKTTRTTYGYDLNGSGIIALNSSLWMNTAAVTTITIAPNTGTFNQYSQFALYGVK